MPVKYTVKGQVIQPEKLALAREFRSQPTEAEDKLWQRLRRNQLDGWHFRRQQIIAGFIVDFYCHQAGLILEADGPVHDRQRTDDLHRDQVLTEMGYRVMRISNDDMINRTEIVMSSIRKALQDPKPGFPSPPLQGDPESGPNPSISNA